MCNEIEGEILTEEEKYALVKKYLESNGEYVDKNKERLELSQLPESIDAHHLACGLCGMRKVHGRYEKFCKVVKLEELPKCISLTEHQLHEFKKLQDKDPLLLPINEKGETKEFDF